jgi:hypothetical protein
MQLAFVAMLIILPVMMAVIFVVTDHKRKLRQMEHLHRERLAAIEKGLLPPTEPMPDERPSAYLFRGLVFLALGVLFVAGPFAKLGMGFELTGWVILAGAAASLSFFGWQTLSGKRAARKEISSQVEGP